MERELNLLFGMPPHKAIEYLQKKGIAITQHWYDLWQDAHSKAFTVAKITQAQMLQDIKDLIEKSITEGLTFENFKKEFKKMLQTKGYTAPAGFTPWRLETIYRTNLQSAYMRGRYYYQTQDRARPYWMYEAVLDSKTRPAHRGMHGEIFRKDDPIWNIWYPPNGFNCRCRVRSLTKEEAEKIGISEGKIIWKTENITKTDPTSPKIQIGGYIDEKGNTYYTDKGFSYNPAKAFENWVDIQIKTLPKELQQSVYDDIQVFQQKNKIEVSVFEIIKKLKEGEKLQKLMDNFEKHLKKRINEGVVKNEEEYKELILKILEKHQAIIVEKREDFVSVSYIAQIEGQWYITVFRENKIMTAFKVENPKDLHPNAIYSVISNRQKRLVNQKVNSYIFYYALENIGVSFYAKS